MLKIARALLSVWDKEGIVDLARALHEQDVELVATSGTTRMLKDAGIPATELSGLIDYPEILGGRVKTLHPAVHGAILANKRNPGHMSRLRELGIRPFDMVVVNLYPFDREKNNSDLDRSLEFMDIGGNTLLRASAKNFKNVAVVTSPEQYIPVCEELKESGGMLSRKTLFQLATSALAMTSSYDVSILGYLQEFGSAHEYEEKNDEFTPVTGDLATGHSLFPQSLTRHYEKVMTLRYGENPHQKAALYKENAKPSPSCSIICNGRQFQGKELSYNNYVDLDGAVKILMDFEEPTAVVIKHTNPCGLASEKDIYTAYKVALATDPMSAFGGVVGLNRRVDARTAGEIKSSFKEAVIAPDYEPEALEVFTRKKNLRVIKLDFVGRERPEIESRSLCGGIICQEADRAVLKEENLEVVSKRKPTREMMASMLFARKVVKHVKSNAIVYVKGTRTIGIGAGQMSRVDSAKIAAFKACENTEGAVMASDAFFPFRDGIDAAHEAGIVAIIQPGGSIRDNEVIQAVDEHDMVMVFTGMRCFNH